MPPPDPERVERAPRCARCALHVPRCLCGLLVPRATRTRVVVLLSGREARKPTNTGRLVPLLLSDAVVRPWGGAGRLELDDVLDGRRVLVLDATGTRELGPDLCAEDARPITLLVPDGTWRQTRRATRRERALAGLPRVRLPSGPPSRYRLRDAGAPGRVATLEAVARALGVLEGPEVQAHLEAAFEEFVERALRARGTLAGS